MEPLAVRIRSSTEWLSNSNERSSETLGFETRAERDLMLVLHRPIEPTGYSGHSTTCADPLPSIGICQVVYGRLGCVEDGCAQA